MANIWLGWHFLAEDRRLRWGSGEVVEAGKVYTAKGPLVLCRNGVHASARVLDALRFAPGPIICRVALIGERLDDQDKSCARSRRVLWMVDATRVLHEFACWCAEGALNRERAAGREPDPRSWAAIETKRRWLRGEASDKELGAAFDAASAAHVAAAAAADAAFDAAYSTYAAAYDAAYSTYAVAHAAARSAVRAAAYTADVGGGARDAQNQKLEEMLEELHGPSVA